MFIDRCQVDILHVFFTQSKRRILFAFSSPILNKVTKYNLIYFIHFKWDSYNVLLILDWINTSPKLRMLTVLRILHTMKHYNELDKPHSYISLYYTLNNTHVYERVLTQLAQSATTISILATTATSRTAAAPGTARVENGEPCGLSQRRTTPSGLPVASRWRDGTEWKHDTPWER